MFLSIFVPIVSYFAGKKSECYRETTRALCDWYFDRPSTSQTDYYSTIHPRLDQDLMGSEAHSPDIYRPNTIYPISDEYWNTYYRQVQKMGPTRVIRTQCETMNYNILQKLWYPRRTTPFQNFHARPRNLAITADKSADQGSSVDPCDTRRIQPNYTADKSGSSVGPCYTRRTQSNYTADKSGSSVDPCYTRRTQSNYTADKSGSSVSPCYTRRTQPNYIADKSGSSVGPCYTRRTQPNYIADKSGSSVDPPYNCCG